VCARTRVQAVCAVWDEDAPQQGWIWPAGANVRVGFFLPPSLAELIFPVNLVTCRLRAAPFSVGEAVFSKRLASEARIG